MNKKNICICIKIKKKGCVNNRRDCRWCNNFSQEKKIKKINKLEIRFHIGKKFENT